MQQQLVCLETRTNERIEAEILNILWRCSEPRLNKYQQLAKWQKIKNILGCFEIAHAGTTAHFITNACARKTALVQLSTPIRKHKKHHPKIKLHIIIHIVPHKDCFIYEEQYAEMFLEKFGCNSPFASHDVARLEKEIQLNDIKKAIIIIREYVKTNFSDMDIDIEFEITWGEFMDPDGRKIIFEKIFL